jgi:hypothetical protein
MCNVHAYAAGQMNNCFDHLRPETIQMLSDNNNNSNNNNNIKIITFPLQMWRMFWMLDFVFFGVLKSGKKHLCKDSSLYFMGDHEQSIF